MNEITMCLEYILVKVRGKLKVHYFDSILNSRARMVFRISCFLYEEIFHIHKKPNKFCRSSGLPYIVMDDGDIDFIDELFSSFCTPCTSRTSSNSDTTNSNESLPSSSRKRTSTISSQDTSKTKKACLSDISNRSIINEYDEINTLDESALQMLVREEKKRLIRFYKSFENRTYFCFLCCVLKYFSVTNGSHDHNFLLYCLEWLVYLKNIEIFNHFIVIKFKTHHHLI